jgi:hypothetical protein
LTAESRPRSGARPGAGRTLCDRLARYISNPLSPIEIRELPAKVAFKDTPPSPWRIGNVEVKGSLVSHRGPTLGYPERERRERLLPTRPRARARREPSAEANWISGHALARDASLLIHDCQYAEDEYRAHRGWGHSSLPDTLTFARRCEADHLVLFHHDPAHDDARLRRLQAEAVGRWAALGSERPVEMAREGQLIDLAA